MTIVSVSLTSDLLEKLDDFVEKSNYSSRSEAIRMAVRDVLTQFSLKNLTSEKVMATVTVIYETPRSDISSKLIDFRHGYAENIFGNMHLHIGESFCVEIFLVQGSNHLVMDFVTKVRAVRGINEVNYTLTPIDEHGLETDGRST